MYTRLGRHKRAIPVILGTVTLVSVALLLLWDIRPSLFPTHAHDFLGGFPLAMIAIAYLWYQGGHKLSNIDVAKAITLAAAFLFWAANQYWPDSPQATLYNDVAIALFVLDIFWIIVGWPAGAPDVSFGEDSSSLEP
jgi:hypothetical protein